MQVVESRDITRVLLSVVVIGALLLGSVWTLLPFLSALIWAATIVIATWPFLLRLQRLTGGRRSLAAGTMTLLVLLAFIVPLGVAISTLLETARTSPALIADFLAHGIEPPPDWIAKLPWVGQDVAAQWQAVSDGGPEALRALVQPYALTAASAAIAATGGVGRTGVLILLTVVLVGILYSGGETAASGVVAFARRLAGETGERTVRLAGAAIRGVALGVVVTALVQSVLAGIGMWICGIPHAGVLTAIAFVLGIAQIGPLPILAAATLWLYWIGNSGWAIALVVWSVPVVSLDNVLRPILIRRGVDLPLLLIMAGVIGGLVGFGVVGLFIGPVVLAVTYTLVREWIAAEI
jgi:predicted PurR-regulated permease PerM